MASSEDRIIVAEIGRARGLKGEMTAQIFLESADDLVSLSPLINEAGEKINVLQIKVTGKGHTIILEGVSDRNAAEAKRGQNLYAARSALPAPNEDEFYHWDMIGLTTKLSNGNILGKVTAVYNFGAGDLLEIKKETGGQVLIPFTREIVPILDFAAGELVIEPVQGLLENPNQEADLGSM